MNTDSPPISKSKTQKQLQSLKDFVETRDGYFVNITFAALSVNPPPSVKSRLCVFILPHALLLLAFVLRSRFKLRSEVSDEEKILPFIILLSDKVNKYICVTMIIIYFTSNSYPTVN